MNHLLVRAVGSEVFQVDVLGAGGLSGPDHERDAVNGQLPLLHFAKNDVVGQALVALFEDIGVSGGGRVAVYEAVKILRGETGSGGDVLATVEAVAGVDKVGRAFADFI